MRNTGVYQISIGDYFYIGQSSDLKKRESNHLSYLKNGNHHNKFMQRVYDKYQSFSFTPLVYAEIKELNRIEQGLLDVYWGNKLCMNISKCAEAFARGLKKSEEHKLKLSEAQKGEKSHWYGKHHSDESKKKMSQVKKGKKNPMYGKTGKKSPVYDDTLHTFTHEEHGEITCTQYELRTKYNLHAADVSRVISGRNKSTKGWRLKK